MEEISSMADYDPMVQGMRLFMTKTPEFVKRSNSDVNPTIYQEGAESAPPDNGYTGTDTNSDDVIVDYGEMVADSVFLGEMPFNEIISGITEQFIDYIGTEDETNYVDLFYTQLEASLDAVNSDIEEDHPREIKDVLDNLKSNFEDTIFELFETRLTVDIMTIDDPTTEEDEVEYVIRRLYEYFILGAKDNFKTVIVKHILPRIGIIPDDKNDEYFSRIDELLFDYDPLVRCITPTEFIQLTENVEVLALFEDGQVAGNFLRKYSAKLYKNEEFKLEVICAITLQQNIKEDIIDGE